MTMRLPPLLALSAVLHGLVLVAPLGIHSGRNPVVVAETLRVELRAASSRAAGAELRGAPAAAPARPRAPTRASTRSDAELSLAVVSLAPAESVPQPRVERDSERPAAQSAAAARALTETGGEVRHAPRQAALPAARLDSRPDDFVAPLYGLAYLDNPKPDYPSAARHRGVEGRVVVRARVDANGRVLDVGLEQTSGSALLDGAALSAIRAWLFVPARRGNSSVEAYALVPVSFRLGG